MKTLTTLVTADIERDHIEKHVSFLTQVRDAVALGKGKTWLAQFSTGPGVYCIVEGEELIYSGETGSLRGRMRDLLDTRNHTLRRQLGSTKFGNRSGYQAATSSCKFPAAIEDLLTAFMLERLKVRALSVSLGRKEIEEAIIDKYTPKYNIKRRRGDLFDIPGI